MQKTTNAAQYIAGPSTCRRNLNVEHLAAAVENSVQELLSELDELASMLDPIMSQEETFLAPKGECRPTGSSILGERLLSSSDRIDSVVSQIRSIKSRL